MKYIVACCTMKNEATIVREWMAFHKAVGFEKLIIIDNGSSDGTAELVRSFRDSESVDLIQWPEAGSQVDMYNHVLQSYREKAEWCAFIDADEFLYPSVNSDFRNLLAQFGDVGAIGVHWHIYGTAGHVTRPSGLVIENFHKRAADDFIYNRHVKSIVRMKYALRAISSHVFEVANGFFDDAGNELHMGPPYGFYETKQVTHQKLRLNHYHTRSVEEYGEKAKRGYFGVDDRKLATHQNFNAMLSLHDRNEIVDTTAARFVPLMRFYLGS